jgi:hypothetical protein
MPETDTGVEVEKPKSGSGPNPQLVRHLEKAAVQWSEYVTFNTSNAVSQNYELHLYKSILKVCKLPQLVVI